MVAGIGIKKRASLAEGVAEIISARGMYRRPGGASSKKRMLALIKRIM